MKAKYLACSILLLSMSNVEAGLDWTTVHSRANCFNNESITWWYLHPYNWRVVSIHNYKRKPQHHIDTGYNYNWRVAAIHVGESMGADWDVSGYHYLYDYSTQFPFDTTWAKTCSIIDGW
ncbi:MAG: hypothetical protein Q8M03_02765 [Legionella sp.]|nr:hypothetical protein [Legionella sp.]